jgi:hypothetical protein
MFAFSEICFKKISIFTFVSIAYSVFSCLAFRQAQPETLLEQKSAKSPSGEIA